VLGLLNEKLIIAEKVLNQLPNTIKGTEVSFFVHYWGATPKHYDNPLHTHSFYEVCFVMDGEGTYIDSNNKYPLIKNTLFLSRPDKIHQIKSETGLSLLFVAFEIIRTDSTELGIHKFRELLNSEKVVMYVEDESPGTLMWRNLIMQSTQTVAFQKDIVYHLSYSLLLSLLNVFTEQTNEQITSNFQLNSSLLYRTKLYIRDNLSQQLSLNDVASYLHISERHLSRLFSKEFGESFTSYIRKIRIQKATTLLTNSELSIKHIADETGYNSVHYFTRVFTSETGQSPGSYRAKNRKNLSTN
jgi:AraC family transcriptional regulator of arabinose operon